MKPNPFCGGTDLDRSVSTQDREEIPTAIACGDCGANGPWVYAPANDPALEWNKRHKDHTQSADTHETPIFLDCQQPVDGLYAVTYQVLIALRAEDLCDPLRVSDEAIVGAIARALERAGKIHHNGKA